MSAIKAESKFRQEKLTDFGLDFVYCITPLVALGNVEVLMLKAPGPGQS